MNKFGYALTALALYMGSVSATAQVKQDSLQRDTVLLEEVEVSTGYQTLPAERATGSFERVDERLFNRQVSTHVLSRLDGVMPGILFDKRGPSDVLRVRGLSSIGLTDSRPLIILDNFPYEGDLDAINPNDVASVTLLKDAASASIWGARAGNGVLVITTKKGRFAQPFQLSATSNITIQEKPDLFYQPQVASTDYIDIEKMLFDRGVYNSDLSNTRTWPVVSPVVDILDAQRRGLLTEEEATTKIDALRNVDLRNDMSRYLYREAVMQQYALSLRGGSNRLNTLFSAGFDRNLQSERGNGYTRTTVRNQTSLRPLDKLTMDIGIAYSASNRQSNDPGSISISTGNGIYPYAALVDENGQPAVIARDRRAGYADTAGMGRLLDWRYRPYEELALADNTTRLQNLLFNFSARYQWSSHLSTEIRGQYENQWTDGQQLQHEHSYYVRNLVNTFTQLAGENVIRPVPLGSILDGSRSRLQGYGIRGQANYNRDWSIHRVAAIAGGEIRHAGTESNSDRFYGYDADLRISQGVDYVNRYPRYTNSSLSNIPYMVSSQRAVTRFVSLYANASYTLADRYTVSASARRDASNLFGVATNNKWSPFWSAGLAWNIADEPFYHWSAVPHLKLRTTYGHAGNTDNDRPAVTTIDYRGVTTLGRFPYAIVSNPPNPELRWEDVATWNIGLDFATRGRTLGGSLEYYIKTASDLIALVEADRTSGFNSFSRNSAVLQNHGFDISLYGRHGKGNLGWLWDASFSHTRNKVLEYYYSPTSYSNAVTRGGNTLTPFVGRPAYALLSYRFAGLDPETGDPLGYLNGEVSKDYTSMIQRATENDVILHGTAMPPYFGALRNTFQWKNLSISANVTFRFGYFFRRNTVMYYPILSGSAINIHGDYYKRWQQPGDEVHTTVPSMLIPGSAVRDGFYRDSEATAERGDHIRLQDVNLSYAFRGDALRWGPFREIRATLYARNLGLIWKANDAGLDPDYLEMPAPRSVAFGLSMDF
ncbi:SusC/RagA family TonB-linked outer membrane protein [Parapedobacter pyrenivorans]|uniref:SusC/RagA family TonB-linked outer membrane protein n=1 Tax=Parapedobacter pyrenivorans TaxID=1305674 RepID=A0A917MAR2_9SPHI|nr:SusC/RagA family TonB-linked outer membrane protein [Parapedobacter pyrenivorans]GGG88341.1 SusC/RagA family TonB-linked outer membrane protein [Parapedobacter pyrenivorans]